MKIEKGTLKELNAYNTEYDAYIVEYQPNCWRLGDINACGDSTGRKQIHIKIGGRNGRYTTKRLEQIINENR